MSSSKSSPRGCSGKKGARNLPSWMSSSDNSKSHRNETAGVRACAESGGSEKPKEARGKGKGDLRGTLSKENKTGKKSTVSSCLDTTKFSKLLDGVVFVLSGFVNPDRSTLRSQALEMGAEYQPDWNSDCTLLVCAFQHTPKFRQVEADCGTIVSKDWITECYNQKKLVDIENYLMHAGRPWRKSNNVLPDTRSHGRPKKQVEQLGAKTEASTSSKCKAPAAENYFSPSKLKKWAVDDWQRTIEWLDSQEEKPEPSEIKKVAAEGILTCLQDAIDILEQKQEIDCIIEEWNFVPRVVEELAKLETMNSSTKEDLFKRAVTCKRFYEIELSGLDSCSEMKKKLKTDPAAYDSDDTDQTIEMTEDEIEVAYNAVAYKFCR